MNDKLKPSDMVTREQVESWARLAGFKHFTEDGLARLGDFAIFARQALAAPLPPPSDAAVSDEREGVADLVCKALKRAWQLGQTYWQQADSEYVWQHKKSDETQKRFDELVDQTRQAVAQTAPVGEATEPTDMDVIRVWEEVLPVEGVSFDSDKEIIAFARAIRKWSKQ
jgi:hypothetical protein